MFMANRVEFLVRRVYVETVTRGRVGKKKDKQNKIKSKTERLLLASSSSSANDVSSQCCRRATVTQPRHPQ